MKTVVLCDETDSTCEMLATLEQMRQRGQCCDAVMGTADGAAFRVHRVVMATCSPYFRALFTTPLARHYQGGDGEHKRSRSFVVVPNVSADMLELIIGYAYSGKTAVTKDNVTELLPAADQFNVVGMVEDCERFLAHQISEENCLGIWRFSKNYFCWDLEDKAYRYITYHFPAVATRSDELADLPPDLLLEILQSDDLNVSCESHAWSAAVRWCDQQKEDVAFDCVVSLLRCLRLATMPFEALQAVVQHPLLWKNSSCSPRIAKLVCRVLKDAFMPTCEEEASPEVRQMFSPRLPQQLIFCVGGWGVLGPTATVEVYDSKIDAWRVVGEAEDPSGARAYHNCISVGGSIYVLGGTQGFHCLNSCRRFDTATMTWEEIAPMNYKRCYLCSALLGDTIYAIGGYDGDVRLSSVEKYDDKKNQWTRVADMNLRRSDASACVLGDLIYAAGGFNGEDYMSSVECYSSSRDAWAELQPMSSCRSGVRCVADVSRKRMYAVGGFDGRDRLSSGEEFDPEGERWEELPRMHRKRSNFAVEILEGKIYVMGGFDSETTTDECESYDPATREWKRVAPLAVGRSALSASVQVRLTNVRDYILSEADRVTISLSR